MNVSSSVVATAFVVASAVLAPPAVAAPPPAPPALACGASVEGTVVLDRDLVCTTTPGLVLTLGATLDLGGHVLRGPGEGTALVVDAGAGTGPVSVVGGTVRGWAAGLQVHEAQATVRGVTFDGIAGSAVEGLHGAGVTLESSTVRRSGAGVNAWFFSGVTITGSRFLDNGTGVTAGSDSGLTVTGSVFEGNATAVLCDESYAEVRGTRLVRNTTAVHFDWCTSSRLHDSELVRNGVALRTTYPSVHRDESEGNQVFRNRFDRNDVAVDLRLNAHLQDNRFTRNGVGVRALTAGTLQEIGLIAMERNVLDRNGDAVVVDTKVRMRDNVATRSTGWGIHAPRAVDLGGNVAWGNGREPQCTGVVCAGRPRS
ncbi:right-handed parallel beta-helix repeat-containing protein [Cellulomonas sp. JZ18]|uniref:right-handed parallel beta-helix repeat-containing protein n=1 Tax=Cellulomonas sp. JZ18 TaxID=2654191 RepID=UPI0018AFE557|nr:right-handed parallel beta-helix repeat-containing protein [Cellulomonas sp. JZ18]